MRDRILWTSAAVIIGLTVCLTGCGGGGGGGGTSQAPLAPANLQSLAATSSTITLSWTDRATNETGYEIQRRTIGGSWVTAGQTAAGATQFVDAGLAANTTYEYRVRALGTSANSEYTAAITAATSSGETGVPNAPSGLRVTGTTSTSVSLAWTDNSSIETGFELQRRSGGSFSTIATLSANVTAYTDTGLTSGLAYEYQVRALGASGNSAYSGTVVGVPGNTGGTGTVTGRVASLLGAVPISGARVSIGGAFTTTTLANGTYTIANIPTGNYQLEASASGYQTNTVQIEVKSGANNLGDILLTASGDGPPPPPIF